MENVSLNEAMTYFSRQPDCPHWQTLVRFVDSVADVLDSDSYSFGTSVGHLCIGLANGPGNTGITIHGDNGKISLRYSENWDDEPFQRERTDLIYGPQEVMRPAFLEMLSRLNAGKIKSPLRQMIERGGK
jgi:hypothetical protein